MSNAYIDRLQAVNKRLNTTNIRGKDYAEVNQRILGFWELWPDGRIQTEWLELTESRAVCYVRVFTGDDDRPSSTGTAYEVKTSGGVNSTSYIENAETSAVGRALGMLGIGATNAIASAEEVQNAIYQQESRSGRSKAPSKPVKPKTDKVPDQAAKTPENGSQSVTDATEAQRRRLVDACAALSAVTGQSKSEIMKAAAAQLKAKTEDEYSRVAATVEKMARDAGVKYEGD